MSIPNYQNVVADLAAQYPDEWRAAHTGGPQTEAFIRRLAWVLHRRDPASAQRRATEQPAVKPLTDAAQPQPTVPKPPRSAC